ncbi:hypothetical protein L1887_33280 [Cichorium endivia]|nr:hypothetical protein L1887_33280 [Cichorium endivia]
MEDTVEQDDNNGRKKISGREKAVGFFSIPSLAALHVLTIHREDNELSRKNMKPYQTPTSLLNTDSVSALSLTRRSPPSTHATP